jgi:hypothetical protein
MYSGSPVLMLRYKTGEEIHVGDRVEYDGHPAQVEFVVSDRNSDPEQGWYVEQFGSGVMLVDPQVFGRVFVSGDDLTEDLVFVSRTVEQ